MYSRPRPVTFEIGPTQPCITVDTVSRMTGVSTRDRGTARSVLARWRRIPGLNWEELRTDLDSTIDPWL